MFRVSAQRFGALLTSTTLTTLFLLPTAHAQTASTSVARAEVELPSLTVEGGWLGSSTESDVSRYSGARTLITNEEIQQSGAKTVEDVLRRVPGVQVFDETGVGILPNIGVRGLNPLRSERTLVLVNGVPVAPGPYTGTGLSLFPVTLESIDRIDVVRGGAAVHFGPNNIGGVINIITKPVPATATATAVEKLSFASRSGNVLNNTYLAVGGPVGEQAGVQLQANVIRGATDRERSDTKVNNFIADGFLNFSEVSRLRGQLQYYDLFSQLPGALTPQAYRRDPTLSQRPFDAVKGKTLRGAVTYEHELGENAKLVWTNFGHILDREFTFGQPFDPSLPTTIVSTSPRAFRVFGTEPQLFVRHEAFDIPQKLTLGARYVREDVDFDVNNFVFATNRTTPARQWRFNTDGYAAYISNSFYFFDSRLTITPGLRYERVETDFRDNLSGFASGNRSMEWLPGLSVGYQLTDSVFLFANTNRSLRPPQVAQVTRGGAVGSEVAQVYEIGTRVSPAAGVDLTLTSFLFNYNDQIEFDRARQVFVNLGKTKHQGIELSGRWSPDFLPGLGLGTTYTFVDTEQLTGIYAGRRVPFAPSNQLGVTVDYRTGPWAFAINGYHQNSAFSDPANTRVETRNGDTGPIPAYWLWNARVGYTVSATGKQVSEVALAVNNIFDENYYFRGVDTSPVGRVPAPGRTITLSFRTTF